MDELIELLRALARHEHSDVSIAEEAADRLAELEEQLHLANIDALQTEAERNELASELRQAMDERDAAQAEARVLRERSAHVDRAATRLAIEKDTLAQELARVREIVSGTREQQLRESVNAELLEASKEAEAALAELQREQWVPVSERLPEKEQYPVLVAHRSGAVRMVFGIEPFIDGDWMGYYEPALQGRFLRGITHWMPLPPAPQPEEAL